MGSFLEAVTFASDLFTIFASGIAIFLFVTKREKISSALNVLLNYSSQISLSEIKAKLEKLNELNANEPSDSDDVINILHEIVGQIRGNRRLASQCSELLATAVSIANNPKRLTEPKKRAFVSELRERLRHINLENFDEIIGGKQ